MDLATLQRRLPSIPGPELDRLYARFRATASGDDLDQFLVYLQRQGRISDAELQSLESGGGVELTGFAALARPGTTGEAPAMPGRVAGYTTLGEIGAGSMGAILLARDNELRRKVAYKHIHQDIAGDHRLVDRFCTEAQLTAQLEHPGIVPVYGLVVEADGNVGYAMKLIHGDTLGTLIAEARAQVDRDGTPDESHSPAVLLEHFIKVCDAVHYAHRKGVIHRDLKPDNIMVGRDHEVYVMDWGIAKVVGASDRDLGELDSAPAAGDETLTRTRVGELLGTPMYMSPEQASANPERLDARSDLYTLGLILFELVTLRRPHGERRLEDLLPRVRAGHLEPFVPYSRRQRVPAELKAIIARACAPEPGDRYPTVAAFAADLRRYLAGEAVHALPDTALRRLMRWMAKNRERTLLAVAAVLLVSISTLSWSLYLREEARIEAMAREQRVAALLTAVARQAHRIDGRFLRFEAMLEGLAASAVHLLTRGEPDPAPVYTHLDFADPQRAPPDLAPSPVYGVPISTRWPLIKLAPGVDPGAVEAAVRRLGPLRHYYGHLFLKSAGTDARALNGASLEALVGQVPLPVVWAYVGLETGILSVYPGVGGYPEAYDPRERPWYRESLEHTGPAWVRPYVDVGGLGWMLPCTTPLFDDGGRLLGVAAVEMRLEEVRRTLLDPAAVPGARAAYLLDRDGRVVTGSGDTRQDVFRRGTLINTLADLPPYPHPEVLARVRNGRSGHLDLEVDGSRRIVAFYRLDAMDWTLVVEADPEPAPRDSGAARAADAM